MRRRRHRRPLRQQHQRLGGVAERWPCGRSRFVRKDGATRMTPSVDNNEATCWPREHFADITLLLSHQIHILQSQAPFPLRRVAIEAKGISGGGANEAEFASSSSAATAANRHRPSTTAKNAVEIPSRDLPPAPVRQDTARIYSNMMASTSG